MSTRASIKEYGGDRIHTISPVAVPDRYAVEAYNDKGEEIAFSADSRSVAEAAAQRERLRKDPQYAKYTSWDIVRFRVVTEVMPVEEDEVDFEVMLHRQRMERHERAVQAKGEQST